MGPRHELYPVCPPQLRLLPSNLTQPLEGLAQKLEGWWEVRFTKGRGTCPFPTWAGSVVTRLGLGPPGQSSTRRPCGLSVDEKLETFKGTNGDI